MRSGWVFVTLRYQRWPQTSVRPWTEQRQESNYILSANICSRLIVNITNALTIHCNACHTNKAHLNCLNYQAIGKKKKTWIVFCITKSRIHFVMKQRWKISTIGISFRKLRFFSIFFIKVEIVSIVFMGGFNGRFCILWRGKRKCRVCAKAMKRC